MASGQRDRRGQARALGAHRFLGDLNDDVLTALEHLLDRQPHAPLTAPPTPAASAARWSGGRHAVLALDGRIVVARAIEAVVAIFALGRPRRVAIVQRFGLDVFLADNLGGGAETFDIGMEVGDVQEAGLFESDIDERRLHPGQHARDFALIEVADQPLALVALQVELAQYAVFEHRHAHFKRGCVDYNFALHRSNFPNGAVTTVNTARRPGIQPAPSCRWSGLEVAADNKVSRESLLRIGRTFPR